jgi:hypothetical protein
VLLLLLLPPLLPLPLLFRVTLLVWCPHSGCLCP